MSMTSRGESIEHWNPETKQWEALSVRNLSDGESRRPFVDVVVVDVRVEENVQNDLPGEMLPPESENRSETAEDMNRIMLEMFGVSFSGERERLARQREQDAEREGRSRGPGRR